MRNLLFPYSLAFSILALFLLSPGCGTSKITPTPVKDGCSGSVISGTMLDSLTKQPVAIGWAVLEAGTQLATTQIYNWSETAKAATDIHGSFSFCATAITDPSAVVLVALDSSAKEYPMVIAPVTGPIDLGSILIGGCDVTCGFEGQMQISAPALINGLITSSPVSESGSLAAEYSIKALDGSKNLWNISVPSLDLLETKSFTTSPCPSKTGISCASYSFRLPSEKPIQFVNGSYQEEAGAPTYEIYALLQNPSACALPFVLSTSQNGNELSLTGLPGANLTAADIAFINCH